MSYELRIIILKTSTYYFINYHKEMAKKVVATLKKEGGVKYAKIIKAVKSPLTGAYTFKEEIILQDDVMSALKG